MPQRGSGAILAILIFCAAVAPATGRVQEYQIVRLITYRTSCDLGRLDDVSPMAGPMRFHATCGDLTSYPDGLDVVCDDRDDDRSCHVATAERRFDSLDLMRQR